MPKLMRRCTHTCMPRHQQQCSSSSSSSIFFAPAAVQAGNSYAACSCRRWLVRGKMHLGWRPATRSTQQRCVATRHAACIGTNGADRAPLPAKLPTKPIKRHSLSHRGQHNAACDGLACAIIKADKEGGHSRERAPTVHISETPAPAQRRAVGYHGAGQGCQRCGGRGLHSTQAEFGIGRMAGSWSGGRSECRLQGISMADGSVRFIAVSVLLLT